MNKKMITTVIGLLLVVGFIVLIYKGKSNGFVLESSEEINAQAEALGVEFPENTGSVEPYTKLARKYESSKEYEKAIITAKKAIELFPEDVRGYIALGFIYSQMGNYSEDLKVNQKLIDMSENSCGFVEYHAMILERMDKQDEAIRTLKKYRKKCSSLADGLIPAIEDAKSRGEKYFPY